MGSGALTLVLLRLVGPTGRVVSYETREEFARRAQRNIEARLGPVVPLTIRPQDIYLGIEEREVDRVVLDLPEPWRMVEPAAAGAPRGRALLRLRPHDPPVPARPRGARRASGVRARRDVRDACSDPGTSPAPPCGRPTAWSRTPAFSPWPDGSSRTPAAARDRRPPSRPARTPTRRSAPTRRGRDAGELLQAAESTARPSATEVVAGLTTFMVMAYIIFVNPAILSFAGIPAAPGRRASRSRRPSRPPAWSRPSRRR